MTSSTRSDNAQPSSVENSHTTGTQVRCPHDDIRRASFEILEIIYCAECEKEAKHDPSELAGTTS